MSLHEDDDFDELFDKFKTKKKSSSLKKIGQVDVVKLPIWRDVKEKAFDDICEVCKRDLDDEDIVEACDKCEYFFHYKHIREWLKIKGTCPRCGQ